jgi:hypothetical protein
MGQSVGRILELIVRYIEACRGVTLSPTPDREGGFCQLRTCQAPANAIEIVRTVGISCLRLYSYYSVLLVLLRPFRVFPKAADETGAGSQTKKKAKDDIQASKVATRRSARAGPSTKEDVTMENA